MVYVRIQRDLSYPPPNQILHLLPAQYYMTARVTIYVMNFLLSACVGFPILACEAVVAFKPLFSLSQCAGQSYGQSMQETQCESKLCP